MDLDPYQPCPGGLDKKVKFCCKDLVRELDDLSRKLEGGQLESARSQIDQLTVKHGDRECLMALGCSLALRLDEIDAAAAKIKRFQETAPENPIALALAAMIAASEPESPETDQPESDRLNPASREAMDLLQDSLAVCGSNVPIQVYEAIAIVAQRLMSEEQTIAARELLTLQAIMAGEDAKEPLTKIMEIGRSSASALLKQDLVLPEPPTGPGKDDYVQALEDSRRGAWAKAAKQLVALVERYPDQPIYVRGLANLRLRLAENEDAIRLLRRYAAMENVTPDDAIEAEALAQLMDPETYKTTTDIVEASFAVSDAELMLAGLQSDRHAVSMRVDFSQMATDDSPPPKAGFWLLDRPLPEATDDLTTDQLPSTLCELLLYGKQTDRDARAVLILARGDDYDLARKLLKEIGGESFDDNPDEKVLGQVAAAGAKLRVQTHFPDEVPAGVRGRMLSRRYEQTLLDRWIDVPLDVLDGKSPRQAASDPQLHRALLAAILVLESGPQQHDNLGLYDQLREKLGLPKPQPVSAFEDVRRIPLMRLSRMDPAMMNDDDLLLAYTIAGHSSVWIPIVKLGTELTKRESIAQRVSVADVYGLLAKFVLDRDRALDLIQEAQQAAIARGDSPARWKISELGMRLATGDADGAQLLLNTIQSQHMNEPGIPEMLVQMLAQFGLIRPDGRPVDAPPPGGTPGGAPGLLSGAAPATGAPAVSPEMSAAHPRSPEEPKSKLWLPD